MAYHYIRSLIYRPAVCASSLLGDRASSAIVALADSSKHIIQIVQLLEERRLSFSFCLNRNEKLTLCVLSMLYQSLDLRQEGKLMKDGQRLVGWIVKYLENANSPRASDFGKLVSSMINFENPLNNSCRSSD